MSFFRLQKPRGFHHHYLYVDERKERLKEMERRAMAVKGEDRPYHAERNLKGAFGRSSRHNGEKKSLPFAAALVLALFVIALAFILLWILVELGAQSLSLKEQV